MTISVPSCSIPVKESNVEGEIGKTLGLVFDIYQFSLTGMALGSWMADWVDFEEIYNYWVRSIFCISKGSVHKLRCYPSLHAFGITSTGYQKAYRFRGPRDVFSCNLGKNQGQNPLDAKSTQKIKVKSVAIYTCSIETPSWQWELKLQDCMEWVSIVTL